MPLKADLYPEHLLPVIREMGGDADQFDLSRERFLLNFGRNTARAYWGDLEHWRDWCAQQGAGVDPLSGETTDIERYVADLDLQGYARSTKRRRNSVLRRFRDFAE